MNELPVTQLPQFFTLVEAMSYLKISRTTFYRLHKQGQITGHKIGHQWRFSAHDLYGCLKDGIVMERKERL